MRFTLRTRSRIIAFGVFVLIGLLGVAGFYLIQTETNNTEVGESRVGIVGSAPVLARADSAPATSPREVAVSVINNENSTNNETGREKVVAQAGISVDGIVIDPEGVPVAGAVVRIGDHPIQFMSLAQAPTPGGANGEYITNEKGYFSAPGFDAVTIKIQIRARGFAPFRDNITIKGPERHLVTITLRHGFSLYGKITKSSGEPAKRIRIAANRGYDRSDQGFHHHRTSTDNDGMYELNDLPLSKLLIRKFKDTEPDVPLGTVDGTPGGRVRRDFTILETGEIVGRVRDSVGNPMSGFSVRAERPNISKRLGRADDPEPVVTDAAGRFRIADCAMDQYTVSALATSKLKIQASSRVGPIVPGEGDIEIVINTIRERNATIRGRLLDASGEPVKEGKVYCSNRDFGNPTLSLNNGYFEFNSLAVGQYTIVADCAELPKIMLTPELKENETLDLGNIIIQRTGRLEVSVQMEDGVAAKMNKYSFTIEASDSPSTSPPRTVNDFEKVDGLLVCRSIVPGKYKLTTASAGDFSYISIPFEIQSGETTKLQISGRRGVASSCFFLEADGVAPLGDVTVTIVDSSERIIATSVSRRFSFESNPFWSILLPLGKYHIRAVSDDGRKGESVINITKLDELSHWVEVRLR